MIDIARDTILSIEQARLWLGERLGTAPSKVALRRWIGPGIKGVVLESIRVGGRRFTSHEAINKFIAETSGEKKVVPTARRRREIERASVEVERLLGGTRRGGR